jgi:hypothetical protein
MSSLATPPKRTTSAAAARARAATSALPANAPRLVKVLLDERFVGSAFDVEAGRFNGGDGFVGTLPGTFRERDGDPDSRARPAVAVHERGSGRFVERSAHLGDVFARKRVGGIRDVRVRDPGAAHEVARYVAFFFGRTAVDHRLEAPR